MNKIVLAFPSKADLAEFIIACRIIDVSTDMENCRVTGRFNPACLAIARQRFGAIIDPATDFIESA